MMRKWACLFIALLLGIGVARAEAEPKYFYSDNPDIAIHQVGYPRQCYFSDGETAYWLSGGELWVLGKDFEPAAKLCDTTATAGFAYEKGIVLACPTERGYCFERLDGEVLFEAESDRLIQEFIIVGDCLAARWMSVDGDPYEGNGTRLTAYHLDGWERSVPFELVYDIDPAGNGEVWVARSDVGAGFSDGIFLWNPDSGETRQWETDVVQPAAICGLPIGLACVAGDGNVYAEEMPGEANCIGAIEHDGGYGPEHYGLFVRGSKLGFFNYIGIDVDFQGKLDLQIFDLEQKDQNALTLVNCAEANSWSMKQAVKMLKEAHPEVRVQAVEVTGDALRTKLMANEDGLDILYMDHSDAITYVNAGVLEDLNEHPDILEQLENWIPLDGYTTWNGVRFGLMTGAFTEGLSLNESLREYLPEGLNPEQMTWRELLEAGAQFDGDVNGDGRRDICLLNCDPRFPAFVDQYIRSGDDVAAVNLDTEEFRELMTLYRQCVQNGAFAEVEGDTAILSVEYIGTLDTNPHLPLPGLEGDSSGMAVSAFFVGVNRSSPKKDLALELFRYFASVEAQSKMSYIDLTGEFENSLPLLKDSSTIDSAYEDMPDAWKVNLEKNKQLISNSKVRWTSGDFTAYCGDQVEAYLDGQIELDELIRSLQQRKQMVLMG